ncbi:DUF6438 domain-containing protein [Asticcacaulis sp. SL142]|uniref:DUF6438 domain-containing protein n=1 Tax=Asticcacaulis sp. SL142 TaxID=2995155 RepID=UPI00226C8E4C|nr:DUF6438 domain-containing protein [Asticcacaulis sp. SL142]WAC46785.1 DUF6438 domain-containing protein [Asticcacaulis sp. SL142]
MIKLMAVMGVAALVLGGCAAMPMGGATPDATETLSVSVGPCFGFCPVYKVSMTPQGLVSYDGERHTAVLGARTLDKGPRGYRAVSQKLSAFKPTRGQTADTQCEQRISDQQHYRIVWTAADGTETVLQHDKGCRSPANDQLNKVLESLPQTLGISDWAKQETRPGVSRG